MPGLGQRENPMLLLLRCLSAGDSVVVYYEVSLKTVLHIRSISAITYQKSGLFFLLVQSQNLFLHFPVASLATGSTGSPAAFSRDRNYPLLVEDHLSRLAKKSVARTKVVYNFSRNEKIKNLAIKRLFLRFFFLLSWFDSSPTSACHQVLIVGVTIQKHYY